jgi:hypothetical protein
VEKIFNKTFSLGVQGYWFDQVTGDSGGARLGSFEGRVGAVGVTGACNFMLGPAPVALRLHYLNEFDAKNRLEGESLFLDLAMALWVKMPLGAHP